MALRLPLDISTFKKLRESGYLYIDKTRYAYDLITGGRRYFLSRPRRFGKSLFVSTLQELLSANKSLFDGLWIGSSDYGWETHGVITLDLSTFGIKDADTFKKAICFALKQIANNHQLTISLHDTIPELALHGLVAALQAKYGHVAILIDEYDFPILRALKDVERAGDIRDSMRSFFASIKGLDEDIDFVFITGVSSFAKAGLFSGMNNLRLITLNERFASICGYSDEEIDNYFKEYIQAWADKSNIAYSALRKQIKEWYNGYHFGGNTPSVYNPFSLMNALDVQAFKNFWFQTGTPGFLIEELAKEYRKVEFEIFDPEKFEISEDTLGIFDIGATPLPALMFQTGYLTITRYDAVNQLYTLGYPNVEVKASLQKSLLESLTKLDASVIDRLSLQLRNALTQKNIEQVVALIKQSFSQVAYQEHMKSEKFYHALLQVLFSASGIKTQSEVSISHGRIDLILDLPYLLYLIEIKFNESPEKALAQIEDRKYYDALLQQGKRIILLGLAFKRVEKIFEITYAVKEIS